MKRPKFQREEPYDLGTPGVGKERRKKNETSRERIMQESCIVRVFLNLRRGWGMEDREEASLIPKASLSKPTPKPYLLVATATEIQRELPGSVTSMSKSFELGDSSKKQRNVNNMPGAIGLVGKFARHEQELVSGEDKQMHSSNTNEISLEEQKTLNVSSNIETKKPKATTLSISAQNADEKPIKKPSVGQERKHDESLEDTNSPKDVENGSFSSSSEKKKKKKKKKKKGARKKVPSTHEGAADSKIDHPPSADMSKSTNGTVSSRTTNKKRRKKKKRKRMKASTDGNIEALSREKSSREENRQFSTTALLSPFEGPRPMNRMMTELQVPKDTGSMDEDSVKGYYGKLVQAYLAPFAGGISRSSFFSILRRKNYSLSPPGSNKGIQTILFQMVNKKLFLMDPYEVTKHSKPFYKTRINELIWLLSEVAKSGNVPDTEFLVAIHDCVQTVNANHTYRGAVYMESSPTFTIVSCNFSDNIPFPMWEGDPIRGGLKSWDKKMAAYRMADTREWSAKKDKAVFRGGNRPSMFFKERSEADARCEVAGRSRLSFLGESHSELFDVGVSGTWCGKGHVMTPLSETDHHQYKYILYAEGNCFWADRLNKQVFGPSAIIKQETPCGQFWEPLLKPMTHYMPTGFFFEDTTERIEWARKHDDEVQSMVKNANEFAANFLSEKGIMAYVEVLLTEYTKLLEQKEIEREKGSRDVTVQTA